MKTIRILLLCSLWTLFLSAGTASKPAGAAHAGLSDAQLEAVIRAKFAKSKIHTDGFTVHVKNGIATVEGQTGVIQHKGVATRMCKTAGAIKVENKVLISDAAKQKMAAQLQKGQSAQVKAGAAPAR